MVAAESSVTKNVGDYKIVGGCPARIIGRRKPGLISLWNRLFYIDWRMIK